MATSNKLLVLCAIISTVSGQSVTLTQGTVVGSLASDGQYVEFYGIPYADSTAGSQRFKAPAALVSSQDTLIADRRDIKCVRPLGIGYEGTEDCLVLNVFTPDTNPATPMSVIVWVKGKEFVEAIEPELSLKNFMEQNVVVVSLNYRESILGFLCLGTETAPGNAGLKDIVAGLQWVQENIAAFGGDPTYITLMGHGSGAAAVDLVSLSPLSEGLVQKVILQSGNSLSPWAVTRDPIRYAFEVAEALGHVVTDNEQLSEVFSRTSLAALMGVMNELDLTDNSLAFSPCIENEGLEEPNILTKSPFEILSTGNFSSVPTLIGYVENEGTIKISSALERNWLNRMNLSFADFLQSDLKFVSEDEKNTVANEIRNYYFGNVSIDMEAIENYVNYQSHTMIKMSALREARMRVAFSPEIYLYQFSYQGSLGEPFAGPLSLVGANHGEELGYLFTADQDSSIQLELSDSILSYILVERWTNFAKTSNPTSAISSNNWLPTTLENTNVLLIRNEETENAGQIPDNLEIIVNNPDQETVLFWDNIYEAYFNDAEGAWTQTVREDDDEEEIASTTNAPAIILEGDSVEVEEPATDSATAVSVQISLIITSFYTYSLLNW